MKTNNVKKQDGWAMRLLTAVCEKMYGWVVGHELDILPHESQTFLFYGSSGWEEAYMYQVIARINHQQNMEA